MVSVRAMMRITNKGRQESSSKATVRRKRNPKYETKSSTSEFSFHNNSEAKTIIKYETDETLDIKQEIIHDEETTEVTDPSLNQKNESKVCTVYVKEDFLVSNMKQQRQNKQEIQNSEPEIKYKCKKCARSYKEKKYLTIHKKYECGVTPQFMCHLCGRQCRHKSSFNSHMRIFHLPKSNSETSKVNYNCDNCTRSYNSTRGLARHKREKHAAVIPEFICDYCGHKTNRKFQLGIHIIYCRNRKLFRKS
ncbi:zinc finger protein 69 homolog [Belonocnema kinseyi]|uniref:zinc finger protein 69 homolog n=1 Tax=Belonocnema kinseyi TaxID=2817044 RepID=UPI00143CF21E|nr:zinc finger protein 69 homolog [Belonocnema kinseyi]